MFLEINVSLKRSRREFREQRSLLCSEDSSWVFHDVILETSRHEEFEIVTTAVSDTEV